MVGRPALLLLLVASACAKVERSVDAELDATGLTAFVATIDRGDFAYEGGSAAFSLDGRAIGYGGSKAQAERRLDGVDVSLQADGTDAVLEAASEFKRAWVDLEVAGPGIVDTDIWVKRGSVDVSEITGRHLVTADRITSQGLHGDVDLLATAGGMDVDVWPGEGGEVLIESSAGDTILRLPYGGAYDIEVIGDPAYEMVIEDLGFLSRFDEVGYFAGTVGDGSIRVVVYVSGGSFQLLESS